MVLKVDKKGKLPEKHNIYKGRCQLCTCEVSTNDTKDLESGYSGMDSEFGYYVMCPTEGCKCQIPMEKVVYRGRS